VIEWVKKFISVSLAFKIQNLSFRQLTKSVEVYLTAGTGQFRKLRWFARMTLAAENVSMCKNKISCFQIRSNVKLYGDFIWDTLKSSISGTKILTQNIIMTDGYFLDVFVLIGGPYRKWNSCIKLWKAKLHLAEK